jgi:hypothetical protein
LALCVAVLVAPVAYLGPFLEGKAISALAACPIICGLTLWLVGAITVHSFIMGPMRSRCPSCGKKTAAMTQRPDGKVHLTCVECHYDEPTGF